MSVRASVVIPLRNAENSVGALLDALSAQTLPASEFEVLIADDASTDGTAAAVERHGGARLVRLERWSGAYVARNRALEVAAGDVIAFTDGDCRPARAWLEEGLADLDRLGADLIAGHVEVPLSRRPGLVELVDFSRFLDQERSLREAGFGATANLLVRREVLDAVGGFPTTAISEGDRELCERAAAAGFRIAYSPRAAVVHLPRTTVADLSRRGFRDGFGRAQVRARGGRTSRQLWSAPGAWFPSALVGRTEVYGIERLEGTGTPLPWWRRRAMGLVEWAVLQIPMVLGNLLGAIRFAAPERIGDRLGRHLPA